MDFESKRDDLIPERWALGQVQKGTPRYRAKTIIASPDGALTCGLWDCTAGTFTWHHGSDEIVQILEGEVIVDGKSLVPGSVAYFAAGRTTMWEVPKYVKKVYVLRAPTEGVVRRVAGAVARRFLARR